MKVPIPHSAFSDTTKVGSWGTLLACQEWKSRLPTQPALSVCVGGGHSFFCGVWMNQSSHYLKVSCLVRLLLSSTCVWRKQPLRGRFFVLCTLVFTDYRLLASPMDFTGSSVVKNPPANAGDVSSTPGSGRPPGKGDGNPCLCSCLGNPMDRESWQATVHGVTKESDVT